MDLSEFLLARIADDEAANDEMVRAEVERCRADGMPGLIEDEVRAYWSDQPWWRRRLAECDAKRRIVGWHVAVAERVEGVPALEPRQNELGMVLRALALPYADHADYRQEWKP